MILEQKKHPHLNFRALMRDCLSLLCNFAEPVNSKNQKAKRLKWVKRNFLFSKESATTRK